MGNYSCSWQSFCYDLPFGFFVVVVFFRKKNVTIEKNTTMMKVLLSTL